ncbi:HAD family hydrolase [Streptomyces sp. NPDC001492]
MPSTTAPVHIVWDWNGTLKDDRFDLLDAVNHTLAGLRTAPIDLHTYQTKHVLPIRHFYDRLLNRSISDGEWTQAQKDFAAFLQTRSPRLRPRARQLLAQVNALGHSQSVLSLYPEKLLRAEIEALSLTGLFTRIDGRRGADGTKTEVLTDHLQALALSPGRVFLIGDTVDDGYAAHTNGIHAILCSGGLEPAERLHATRLPVVETLDAAVTAGIQRVTAGGHSSECPQASPAPPPRGPGTQHPRHRH